MAQASALVDRIDKHETGLFSGRRVDETGASAQAASL
jgi:hypothetical protein